MDGPPYCRLLLASTFQRNLTISTRKLDLILKQECIPVGYVPPAAVAIGGGGVSLHQAPPPDQDPLPGTRYHPLRDQTPQEQAPPGTRHPPRGQNSWHTLLKILPCPKLRLRTVIKKLLMGKTQMFLKWRILSTTFDVSMYVYIIDMFKLDEFIWGVYYMIVGSLCACTSNI